MKLPGTFRVAGMFLALSKSLGGTSGQSEREAEKWEFSLSTATYVVQEARDFVNPNLLVDHGWLHLEARYNYEAYKTGSVWLGYNFSTGDKLAFEITPMLGGVFGDINGVAPGYSISITYKALEFSTQGEYFFDAATRENDFFYTWSELSCAPTSWFRFGLVVDRTKVLGNNFDIRRGPLVGFQYKHIDFTTYWLNPGFSDETFIFSLGLSF